MTFYNDWMYIDNIGEKETNNLLNYVNNFTKKLKPIDLNEKSTRGINSKQYELFGLIKNKDRQISIVKEKIKFHLNKFVHKELNLELLSAWTVLGQKDSYHTLHKHNEYNTKHIATVLYLETPPYSKDDFGNFYFLFRHGSEIIKHSHKPRKGDLIIFPVWIWHGAYPQQEGLRQTLNLDFKIVDI